MTKINYSNRVIFFIDVLGFRNIVNDKTPEFICKVFKDISNINQFEDDDKNIIRTKIITKFSDSIVISFEYNDPSQLFWILGDIQWVIYNLVNKGVFLRGAAAIGNLFHSDEYIFGPALNDAYKLESTVSVYPRIIISEEIINKCSHFSENPYLVPGELGKKLTIKYETESMLKYLKRDFDGYYYIDYFTKEACDAAGGEFDTYNNIMNKLKDLIEKGLKNSDISVQSKYKWAKEKYNEATEAFNSTHDPVEYVHINKIK